ncbi:MAG: AAA family ATPase [Fibrobacterota bacterium]
MAPASVFDKFITIGGGKGGVGKTTAAAGIAAALALSGHKVIIIDADLDAPNLHLFLGIKRPRKTMNEYLFGNSNLEEVICETCFSNLSMICGAGGILELSNPGFQHKQKIITNLIKQRADFYIIDIGAGSDITASDFFSLSKRGIIVLDVSPASLENAYGALKNSIVRKLMLLFHDKPVIRDRIIFNSNPVKAGGFIPLERVILNSCAGDTPASEKAFEALKQFRPMVIVNNVMERKDAELGRRFSQIVKKYLNVDCSYIGYIVDDPDVKLALRAVKPLPLFNPDSRGYRCLKTIADRIKKIYEGGENYA